MFEMVAQWCGVMARWFSYVGSQSIFHSFTVQTHGF